MPVAGDDAYDAPSGRTLTLEAPGILGNDTDGAGEDLPPTATAELVSDVVNGALDLAADGSFTYTPAIGFPGSDVFAYRVFVGATPSNVALVELTITGCTSGLPPVTCWDEDAYVAALGALEIGTVAEGFEDDATWGVARTPVTVVDLSSNGITWAANNTVSEITTGIGAAHTGQWGLYSLPHGDIFGAPFDPTRDGWVGVAEQPLVGIGAWLRSNTPGARAAFQLSTPPEPPVIVDFDEPGVTSGHRFFGAIDTRGFTTFEIFETEGVVQDQKLIFADDFTFGASAPVCGDGMVGPGEACDDGNTEGGDCCAADCQPEAAGAPCSDANPCTSPDQCDGAGTCVPGTCQPGTVCGQLCGTALRCTQIDTTCTCAIP